jgi:hypothetical protein
VDELTIYPNGYLRRSTNEPALSLSHEFDHPDSNDAEDNNHFCPPWIHLPKNVKERKGLSQYTIQSFGRIYQIVRTPALEQYPHWGQQDGGETLFSAKAKRKGVI